jgi:Hsp20/alpha crystallin family
VPGVPSSDIDISVLGVTLRIGGRRQEATEEAGEGGHWLLRERCDRAFERNVSLPTTVDAERAPADFKDGVLTIILPTAEIAKPKTIAVSGSAVSAASRPARLATPGGETQTEGTTEIAPQPAIPEATQSPGMAASKAASGEGLAERYATQPPTNAVRGDGTTTCPAGYPVKGNADSGIYHTPDSPSYAQTVAEFCFASPSAAEAAGFQAAGA